MHPIVLVHGAWHDGTCWDTVAGRLRAAGAEVHTPDLPFTGVDEDAAAVAALLDGLAGPAVLVGHSYGGIVISKATAGREDRVAHLVYLCALLLCDGDVMGELLGGREPVSLNAAIRFGDDGLSTIDPAMATAAFYAACPPEAATKAISTLRPFPLGSIGGDGGPIPMPEPWRTVASTYVVCAQDQAIPPSLQRDMATLAGARVEWDTDHSPFDSTPDDLTALLLSLL